MKFQKLIKTKKKKNEDFTYFQIKLLKAVLLLWIICVIYVLFFSCFRVCSLLPCGHLLGRVELLALVCDVLLCFVTFPCGILGQVWYMTVSIPDLCHLSYFRVIVFILLINV